MREYIPVVLLLALIAGGQQAVLAGDVVEQVVSETARKVISETERRIIREYYGDHGPVERGKKGKGPGKDGRLPPGLQMQLERKGRLPPGLEKKSLPSGLAGRLPPVPKGYERVIVGSDVLLVHVASQVIADMVVDVVFEQ